MTDSEPLPAMSDASALIRRLAEQFASLLRLADVADQIASLDQALREAARKIL